MKGKTSLDLNEARDNGFRMRAIDWTIGKQSAHLSRQITTSTLHHSIFTGRMLFLAPNQQCQRLKAPLHAYNFMTVLKYSWHITHRQLSNTGTIYHFLTKGCSLFCRASSCCSLARFRRSCLERWRSSNSCRLSSTRRRSMHTRTS